MKKEKIKTVDGQTLLDTVTVPAPQNIVTIVTGRKSAGFSE